MKLEFGLLGELRVVTEGSEIPLTGARQRALLARLLLSRNEAVPYDRLAEDLYVGSRNGQKALQVAVARLRNGLGARVGERLVTREAGYELVTQAGELDSERLESELARGSDAMRAGDLALARRAVAAALAKWRGTPLGEFANEQWARGESARLQELHLQVLELGVDADMQSGAHQAVIPKLERLVALHPARERLRERLMLALYRAGRQADALAVYRDARRHLVEEHGIEPGRELRELQQAILLQDPSLIAPRTPARVTRGADPVSALAARAHMDDAGAAFVGRVAERAALDSALEKCSTEGRVAVLVSGEPGIGKTRLAAEAAALARARGFAVLVGRCDDDLAIPFRPIIEALDPLVGSDAETAAHPRVAEHGAVLARLFPLHGPEQAAARAAEGEPRDAHAEGLQYALFAAITALLADASRAQPLLMVLEDLHWADRPTLMLLKHLLASPVEPRLMILATYRSSELRTDHPLKHLVAGFHRERRVLRLELIGLLDAEVAELVGALAGQSDALTPQAASALRRSTAGNPFFVTEVTRALLDAGRAPLDAFSESRETGDATLPLPLAIRETVGQRVARLPEATAHLLTAASVLGVTFDPGLVARLAGRPRGEALAALDAALSASLVIDSGERMAFRHALIAHSIYETLSAVRRRELHARAGDLMAAERGRGRTRIGPAAIAHHYARAGLAADRERTLEWLRRAAEDALAKLAPQEAQRWYGQALTLVGDRDDSDRLRCELLIGLGDAQRQSGDPGYRDTLLEAARVARACGEDDAFVLAALANTRGFVSATGGVDDERIAVLEHALALVGERRTPIRARLLATLAGELSFSGDLGRRVALSDEALEIARECGDPQTLVHVISPRTVTIWSPATLAERIQNTAQCMRAADLLDDPVAQFQAVHWRASACIESGAFAEAAACRTRARKLAEGLRQPTALWMARYDQANEALIAGRLAAAEQLANEAYAIGEQSGQPDALLILASQLMVIRYEQGRLGECVELVAQSLEHNPRITGFRAVLALGYCEERRYEDAAVLLQDDAQDGFSGLAYDLTWLSVVCVYAHVASRLACAGITDLTIVRTLRGLLEPWREQIAYTGAGGWGLVESYLGMLQLADADAHGAVARLENAVGRAERLPAPVWTAHCRLELARALSACGRHREAEPLLRRVCRDAVALGCSGIEREGGELLAGSALTA